MYLELEEKIRPRIGVYMYQLAAGAESEMGVRHATNRAGQTSYIKV